SASTVFTNSSGVHAQKGGAFGAMAVLMLNDQMPRHFTSQRQGKWQQVFSGSITRKTVLIYGLGALGSAIAARLRLFGPRLLGISRSGRHIEVVDKVYKPQDLKDLLPKVDILVLSCPLTDETRGLIGRNEIQLMKPGASIFNIARAGVMDYEALEVALRSGHLNGAILDVFDPEPLPADSTLWDCPN